MCERKNEILNKNGNLFGTWSNCGFKLITVSLLVLCLGVLQLVAIPNRAEMFQTPILTQQSNSQSLSLESLSNPKTTQGISSKELTEILTTADGSLQSASSKLQMMSTELETQKALVDALERSTVLIIDVNKNLSTDNGELTKTIANQQGVIDTLKGNKLKTIFDVGGTYNTLNGWGVSTDIGWKYGIVTTKFGVQALVADIINPIKLKDINTYTFKASMGLEW